MVELEERIERFIDRVRISQMGAKEEKFYEKMNKYFSNLIKKIEKVDFKKELNDWMEEFMDINYDLWDYVHENKWQNEWVKDKPDYYKKVLKCLKKAMDLINMCYLLNGGNEDCIHKDIVIILHLISENEAFPLYAANLDKEESKQKTIARLIKDLFDGARYLNYIEELDDMNKKLKLNTGE
jgi:hypothetical protein